MRQRPQTGPVIVLAAAAGLFVLSLMTWYEVDLTKIEGGRGALERFVRQAGFATHANAWEPWGFPADLVLFLVIGAGATLAVLTLLGVLRGILPALGAIIAGSVGTAIVLLHVISGPQPTEIVSVQAAAWLGLLCCLAMLGGAFLWWDRAAHPRVTV